jgi:predicted nucleic acid-binding protein
VGPDHFAEALGLLRRHRERRLSFTDCTSMAVMAAAGIAAIATFDKGFDGLVARVGEPPD